MVGRTIGGKNLGIVWARKIGVVVQTQKQYRIEKRELHSKFSKHQVMFLHKSGI